MNFKQSFLTILCCAILINFSSGVASSADGSQDDIEAFVTRFYQLCLGRSPDPNGLKDWVDALLDGSQSGGDVANGFVFSKEFLKKAITDKEYLQILYEAFFDRKPDPAGQQAWLDALASGSSREDVLKGFIYATEFINLCDKYGILAFKDDTPKDDTPKASIEDIEAFVTRFYQLCLGRDPDPRGLETWSSNLINQTQTGADVAHGFIESIEFIEKNNISEDYLTILYKAFFNRDPDPAGYRSWMEKLNAGTSRGFVLDGFLYSREFAELCGNYGILPYAPFDTSCTIIAGEWYASESVTINSCLNGSCETDTFSGNEPVTIQQNGCNFSYDIDVSGYGPVTRKGIIIGNIVQLTGFSMAFTPRCTTSRNDIDISGTVAGGTKINWRGSGIVNQTCDGDSYSDSVVYNATFQLTYPYLSNLSSNKIDKDW